MEIRVEHRTALPVRQGGGPVACAVRQADPPVVPVTSAFHEQSVNSVDRQGAHCLQNVGDGWRSRTGVAVVIRHIRIEAAYARTMFLLNEDVATIAVAADPGEDHRDPLETEMPAGRHPRGVVVHPANDHVAAQVDVSGDGFLEAKIKAADFGSRNTLSLQVPSQRQGLVPADILYIEPLTIEVAGFDYVLVQK